MTVGQLLDHLSREVSVTEGLLPMNANVSLPNDWSVSVVWHSGSYSSHRFDPAPPSSYKEITGTVEIAIFNEDYGWYCCPEFEGTTQVFGWIDAETLQQVVDRAAQMPSETCPCPDCIHRSNKEK